MSTNSSRIKTNQNIQVYLRVRPTNDRERIMRSLEMIDVVSNKEMVVKQGFDSKMSKKFTFDRVFGPQSKQTDLYQTVVAPLIEEVLAGYNCTVFAYGQTGTGKTHTMVGEETPKLGSSWDDKSDVGIIPRALSHLFDELRMMELEFSMRISYLELYNEELCDLLSTNDSTQIRIFDDASKKGSIIIQGLEEIPVHNTADVYKLLAKGQEKRKTASTLMNAHSSRSHTIFSILVHIRENGIDGEELLKIGKLNLVDLAGSENISKAGNEKGIRTRETVNINQSLLTLGRVITALVERTPHIPYRESKLTRLLQESLGGRTKTSIIATVSPGHKDLEETLSTLEYAHRAKNIQNKPEINQKLTKKTVLKDYTEEIDRLKRDLMATRDKNGVFLSEETYSDLQYRLENQNKELNEKMLLMKALKDELTNKQTLFTEVSLNLVERTEELKSTENNLISTQEQLGETRKILSSTEKRYQENTHLLSNHMKTEEILTAQATQLIDTANKASGDTYRLHDTIERRKIVDRKLENAGNEFERVMHSHLDKVNANLEELKDQLNFNFQTITQKVVKNTAEHDEFTSTTILNLEKLLQINNDSYVEIEKHIDDSQEILSELSEKQKADISVILLQTKQRELNFNNCLKNELGSLMDLMANQKQLFCANYMNILEMININETNVNNFCNQQNATIKTLCADLMKAVDDNRKTLETNISNNQQSEVELQEVIVMLQNLLQKKQTNNQEMKNVSANMTLIEKHIAHGFSEQMDNIKSHKLSTDHETLSIKNNLEELNSSVDKSVAINKEQILLSQQCVDQHNTEMSQYMDQAQNDLEKQFEQINNRICVISNDNKVLENKYKSTVSIETNKFMNNINEEKIRFNTYEIQNTALNNLIHSSLRKFVIDANEDVENCREKIRNFHTQDIKTYSSTGETPAKISFDYPKLLAATSPHTRILKRFWQNYEGSDLDSCSTSISDGNESTFMLGLLEEQSSSLLQQEQTVNPLQEIKNRRNDTSTFTKSLSNSLNSECNNLSTNKENKNN